MSDAHDPHSGSPAGGPPPPPGFQQPPQPQYPQQPQPQYPQQPQYPPVAPQPQYPQGPPQTPYPQAPQYPPTAAQPQYPQGQPQYPPTQQIPAGGYGPGPTPGYGAPVAGGAPPKKTGMLVGAGVAAVAVLGGGAFLLLGGDDEKSTTTASTIAPVVSTIAGPSTTLVVATTTPATTVVITLPPTTAPVSVAPTVAPTTPTGEVGRVTDDLGVFSVLAPDGFETDTASLQSADGIVIASIIVADSVTGYNNDHETSGFQVFVASMADDVTAASLLSFMEPGEGVCTSVSPNLGFPTAYGGATMMVYTGCGSSGADKRLLVVEVPEAGKVIGVYLQEMPSEADLTNVAQIILESVELL